MEEHRRKRTKAFQRTVGANFAAKLFSVSCTFLQVPIALKYLGTEAFGVWATLSSITNIMIFADLGLGSVAQNQVSHAVGNNDPGAAYRTMATAFVLLSGAGAVIAAAALFFCFHFDWSHIFPGLSSHFAGEIPMAFAVLVGFFAAGLPLAALSRLTLSFQVGWLTSLSSALNAFLTLAAVFCAAHYRLGFIPFIALGAAAPVIANLIVVIMLLVIHPAALRARPTLDRATVKSFFKTGFFFFVPTVGCILFTGGPTLILSSVLGPAAVVPYQLMQRLMGVSSQVYGLMILPLWPAYTEARARGDEAWIRGALRKSLLVGLGLFAVPVLSTPLWGAWVIHLWSGYTGAGITFLNLSLMALLTAATLLSQGTATFLSALGHLLSMATFGFGSVILTLAIMPYFAAHWGLSGGLLAILLPFVGINFAATSAETFYRLRHLDREIALVAENKGKGV